MTGRVGFGVAASVGPEVAAVAAPEVERLGYASFWSNDGAGGPGLPVLAAAQRATGSIPLGVGVIPISLRAPSEILRTVRELALDVGRLAIGIGSGSTAHPLAAVREGVSALRLALPGARVAVAALGPRMCRLAGELADVVLLNWMTPERVRWARRRVEEGERIAGRAPGTVVVASYVRVALGPDAALRLAREAERYARIPQYARSFAAMGVDPRSVGIAAIDRGDILRGIEPYRRALDEVVVRALPARDTAEDLLAIARGAR